ncbi:cupin domain-containing protein [Mucilaginibacter hurinus]|uniref:Cupin domain-containing protein n=1 Tax=Mucilaginibacter hurinus TaxID=2201324 RepID=A0A367GRE7_9SPHI|nr:cupin domain-containing protein [Mucilaginibacter hurinus]RCH55283.1 cupin domain-containing protein [Mucilaginibacter hurinus]
MATFPAFHYINTLQMQPHPEGGYYKEVFRSPREVVRKGEDALKKACTSIYYLLQAGDYSGFHRLQSDEIWCFHKGEALHIHVLDNAGQLITHELSDAETGSFSLVIPAGLWFASEVAAPQGFSLVSCAVAPGFDFSEFEMARKSEMLKTYPQHQSILNRLCRL